MVSLRSILLFVFIFSIDSTFCCTIFTFSNSQSSIMGNSEDCPNEEGYMSIFIRNNKEYGRVTFSLSDNFVQGGINEYGLAIDATRAPNEMPMQKDKSKTDLPLSTNIIELILKKCKNIDEAISLCKKYNLMVLKNCHIMMADSSGKSVIVVPNKNGDTEYVTKNLCYQLLTNFNPLIPEIGFYPCWRFEKALPLLSQQNINIWDAAKILDAVNQGVENTPYAQVYDCKNKKFSLFRQANYSQAIVFDVKELLVSYIKRIKVNDLPKINELKCTLTNNSIDAPKKTISFEAPEGEYKLYISDDETVEDSFNVSFFLAEPIQATIGILVLLILMINPINKKIRFTSVLFLFVLIISCKKESENFSLSDMKRYETHIYKNENETKYWCVKGKTKTGYVIKTSPEKLIQ